MMTKNSGHINVAIGDRGEVWLASQLPLGWVWQPPRLDLGKDGLIVIRDNSDLHNIEFAIQVKSSQKIAFSKEQIVVRGVSRSSVRYWFASPLPTLVVVVDISNQMAWYAWHLDLFDSPTALFNGKSKEIAVHIPKSNLLNKEAWELIRDNLRKHFYELQEALTTKTMAIRVVASINMITVALRNLVKLLEHEVPVGGPSQYEGITLLLEMIQHRDLLMAAKSVLSHMSNESPAHKQLLFIIESYEAIVHACFPLIDELPEHDDNFSLPPDFQLAYAPRLVKENRHGLIDTGLGLVELLTTIERKSRNNMDATQQGAPEGRSAGKPATRP